MSNFAAQVAMLNNAQRGGNLFAKTDAGTTEAADKPAAMFWINVGQFAETIIEGEDAPRFISAFGMPMDGNRLKEKGGALNRAMTQAQNELADALLEQARDGLEPGAALYIGDDSWPLVIQIRRVNEGAVTAEGENPFMTKPRKLFAVK